MIACMPIVVGSSLRVLVPANERIVAVIPALNAERSIGEVIRGTRKELESVIVVDDGSTDRTSAIARTNGATLLRHVVNRGKGRALKTAFAYALQNGFDGVITLDADGQHLPSEIPKLLRARRETMADLIIGGRSHHFEAMITRRRMANQISAWSIAKASGTHVTDSQSGFRFYSANLIRNVKPRADGFALESEVIVRAGRGGYKVLTIPIELAVVDGVSTSHYRPINDTFRIAWIVLRTTLGW
jgi:glycosyltransferase involved in cell wall biosynthesis